MYIHMSNGRLALLSPSVIMQCCHFWFMFKSLNSPFPLETGEDCFSVTINFSDEAQILSQIKPMFSVGSQMIPNDSSGDYPKLNHFFAAGSLWRSWWWLEWWRWSWWWLEWWQRSWWLLQQGVFDGASEGEEQTDLLQVRKYRIMIPFSNNIKTIIHQWWWRWLCFCFCQFYS